MKRFRPPIAAAHRLLLVALLLAAAPAAALDDTAPWQVTADRLEQQRDSDQYLAVGNVTITRGGVQLSADRVWLDRGTMHARADGHVMVTDGRDVITGQRIEMDLEAETGTVHNGTIFLSENHFYIRGDTLHKTGPSSYRGERVRLTTCDGERPAWHITGRRLEVTLEGYGTVDHATFRARDVPLFYAPRLVFPAKRKRQTGLLPPRVGYSARHWEQYTQPFFWAIDPHRDATFYLHHMERRGEMLGLEYRYVGDVDRRGTLMFDFLDDRKVDDGTEGSEDWAYSETGARRNDDRYWFRFKHDQGLPYGFTARLDVDLVSDPDYLREFKDGLTGFDASDRTLTRTFGRELDAYEEAVRTNRLNLSRNWAHYSLNFDTEWLDDVAGRRDDGVNDVLQELQSVTLDGSRQPLGDGGFYYDLDSEYRYFYLDNRRRGQRLDLHPRVYRPLRVGPYLSLEPSVGVRETVWYADIDGTAATARGKLLSRELADFSLDASTDIYRVYRPGRWGIEALKHNIRPQLVYDYVPRVIQTKYPSYDAVDRIAETQRVSAVVTQTLTSRRRPGRAPDAGSDPPDAAGPEAADGDAPAPAAPVYREMARLEISESYDILAAREENPLERPDANRRRPLSPVRVDLTLSPADWLQVAADAAHSPYTGYYDSHNASLQVTDPRGDQLFVEHRYTYKTSRSVFAQLFVPLTEALATYGEWERNLHDRHNVQIGVGALFTAQCWALDVGYRHEYGGGKQFAFMVHLFGLGGVGKPSVMADRIRDPFDSQLAP